MSPKPDTRLLELEIDDGILRVSMNNGKANALGKEMLGELQTVFTWASHVEEIQGILLLSKLEKIYCAGLDLVQVGGFVQSADPTTEFRSFIFDNLGGACESIFNCPKPIATCVDGHCLAGGLVLALCTDYLCFSKKTNAKVGLTELAIPVPFPYLPMAIVNRRVAPQTARKLLFDAVVTNLVEMFEMGVGDCISDHPEDEATKWLKNRTTKGTAAFGISKKLWWEDVIHQIPHQDAQQVWAGDSIRAMASSSKL